MRQKRHINETIETYKWDKRDPYTWQKRHTHIPKIIDLFSSALLSFFLAKEPYDIRALQKSPITIGLHKRDGTSCRGTLTNWCHPKSHCSHFHHLQTLSSSVALWCCPSLIYTKDHNLSFFSFRSVAHLALLPHKLLFSHAPCVRTLSLLSLLSLPSLYTSLCVHVHGRMLMLNAASWRADALHTLGAGCG